MEAHCGTNARLSAHMAAQLYDGLRVQEVGQRLGAEPFDGRESAATENVVRGFVNRIVDDGDVAGFNRLCGDRLDYELHNAAKKTIGHNTCRDPLKPKYAVVPSGDCCDFCAMLASRGPVYNNPNDCAGFHAHCTCTAVPTWERDKNTGKYAMNVKGYDPGFYLERYKASRGELTTNQDVLSGVVRGEPMSFEKADNNRCNPHLNDGVRYMINCQSSVVAYEARRRGFDVEAMPFDKNGKSGELAENTHLAWYKRGTRETPVPIRNEAANTPKRYEKFLEDTIKPGERYHLGFNWYGGDDGHIVAIERDASGRLMIFDPQNGKIRQDRELRNYLRQFSYKTGQVPDLLRVDELDFNKEYASAVVKGTL